MVPFPQNSHHCQGPVITTGTCSWDIWNTMLQPDTNPYVSSAPWIIPIAPPLPMLVYHLGMTVGVGEMFQCCNFRSPNAMERTWECGCVHVAWLMLVWGFVTWGIENLQCDLLVFSGPVIQLLLSTERSIVELNERTKQNYSEVIKRRIFMWHFWCVHDVVSVWCAVKGSSTTSGKLFPIREAGENCGALFPKGKYNLFILQSIKYLRL